MAAYDQLLGHLFERPGDAPTTPFEDWCREHRIHPEAWGAWERYEADLAATRPAAG